MIEAPRIIETAAQPTACIHVVAPRHQIQNMMGPGLAEVVAALAAQGIAPAGPWFTHHFKRPTDTFDFEICLPVEVRVLRSGRVQPGEIRAATVARTVYHGDYVGLGAGWGEFEAWIAANGHTSAADLWESYVTGPDTSANPADWRTELNRPLVR